MDYNKLSRLFVHEMFSEEKESFLTSLLDDHTELDEAARMKNIWALAQLKVAASDKKEAKRGWRKFRAGRNQKPVRKHIWWRLVAAMLIGGIVSALFFMKSGVSESVPVAYHTLSVPAGQYAQLILSDGSEIWLNSRSKLIYPEKFVSDMREVQFEGEGFFKVVSDKEHPFVVKTNTLDIIATGTQFNVSAYTEDRFLATTLVEGAIKIHSENGVDYEVSTGQVAVYDKGEHRIVSKWIDTDMQISWTQGEFQFKDMSLSEITKRLERNFNVHFIFDDELMEERLFTGTFYNHQSIETILKVIRTSTKRMQYQIRNDSIFVSGR